MQLTDVTILDRIMSSTGVVDNNVNFCFFLCFTIGNSRKHQSSCCWYETFSGTKWQVRTLALFICCYSVCEVLTCTGCPKEKFMFAQQLKNSNFPMVWNLIFLDLETLTEILVYCKKNWSDICGVVSISEVKI